MMKPGYWPKALDARSIQTRLHEVDEGAHLGRRETKTIKGKTSTAALIAALVAGEGA